MYMITCSLHTDHAHKQSLHLISVNLATSLYPTHLVMLESVVLVITVN